MKFLEVFAPHCWTGLPYNSGGTVSRFLLLKKTFPTLVDSQPFQTTVLEISPSGMSFSVTLTEDLTVGSSTETGPTTCAGGTMTGATATG